MRNRCMIVFCLSLLMAGCQIEGPDTGSAAVQLHFIPPPCNATGLRGVLSCAVDTVRVTVSHGGKQLVSEDFVYDSLSGTIENIPAGDGRVFLAQALSGGEVVYQGTRSDVTIAKGQTATVAIDMEPAYTNDVYPPAAVTDLAGQPSGDDINLTWTASGDDCQVGRAASYDLRWSLSTIQASNFDAANPVTGLPSPADSGTPEQFTVTGLAPGQYHLVLKVADDDGNTSPISNEIIVTTGGDDTTAPGDVSDLMVTGVTDTTVTVSWTAPGDDGPNGTATYYDIRYLQSATAIDDTNWDSATAEANPPSPQAAGIAETFTITGLVAGQEYFIALKTGDEVPNWSGVSNSPRAIPADEEAPAAVTDLSSPSNEETSVTLEWTAPGDDGNTGTADHYVIKYMQGQYTAGEFDTDWDSAIVHTNPPVPQAADSTETTTVINLATGATYTFALKTYDEVLPVPNESDISNVVVLQVGEPDTDPPEDTTQLAAAVVNETTVRLTWPAPAEDDSTGLNTATGYDIRYLAGAVAIDAANWATATEATGEPTPQAPTTAESFDVTGLTPDTQYYFALMTVDDQDNWSAVSNSPTATPTDVNPPEDISDLSITAFDETSVSLSWTAPGDDGDTGTVSGYDIRYAEAPIAGTTEWDAATQFGDLPTAPQAAGNTETVTIDTGLTPGRHYYFRMKTVDDVPLWSGMSNEVDQLLPCSACPVVSGMRPPAGPVGSMVSIDGTAFGSSQGTGKVEFGATAATVLSWSDTLILAEVPAGSTGAAMVTLTNDSGFSTTDTFNVTPHIDAITPDTATLPTSPVVINGSGFGATTDTITFSGAPVFTVTSWTDTQIEMDVTSGVVTGPVTVTVGSYISNSILFTITGTERSWGTLGYVNDAAAASVFPRAASDGSDIQVVWAEKDPSATDIEILGNVQNGGAWQGPRNVSDTVNECSNAEIEFDGAGGFHLVYLDSGGTDSIFYTNGKHETWSAAEPVAAESPDARPAIGVLPDGSLVLAWATGGAARYNTRSAAGVWGTASDILTGGTGAASLAGAVDPAGDFHVLYVNGANLVHAWFDGTAWNDGGTVAAAAPGTLVALASDQRGVLHALWWDTTLKYSYRDGGGWTADTAPAAAATAPESLDLIVDASDTLQAVVADDSGTFYEILYFTKPPAGTWSAGDTLSNLTTDSKQPCLATNQDLTLTVFWSEPNYLRAVSWK